jgi:hypothetical protein
MIFRNGKYSRNCDFDLCGRFFFGRLNKKYCSSQCKQAHNNRKASIVNKETNGADLKIKKATRILIENFELDENGKFKIHQDELVSLGFPFDLPTTRIKDDRYNGTMFCFGSYSFYRQYEYFIFYKI